MLKDKWVFSSILAIIFIIMLFLGRSYILTKRSLSENGIKLKQIEVRLSEQLHLASQLNGEYVDLNPGLVFDSNFNQITDFFPKNGAYIFYFDNQMCDPCIKGALSVLLSMGNRLNYQSFVFVGKFPSPRELLLRIKSEGLQPNIIVFTEISPLKVINIPYYPVLLKVNNENLITNSCFVTPDLPIAYYNSFAKQ